MYKVEMKEVIYETHDNLIVNDATVNADIITTPELIETVINSNLLIQSKLYIDTIINDKYHYNSGFINNNWQYYSNNCRQLLYELTPIYKSIRKITKEGKCKGFHVSDVNPMALEIIRYKIKQNKIDSKILRYINHEGIGSKGYGNEAFCLEKVLGDRLVSNELDLDYKELLKDVFTRLELQGVAYLLVNNMSLDIIEKDFIVQGLIQKGLHAFAISYECDYFWRIRITK